MLEEFYHQVKRMEEIEAYYKALLEGFTKKLSPALSELVFQHWNNLNKQRSRHENHLIKLGDKYAGLIFEDFNNAHWLNNNEGVMANLDAVPFPGSDKAHQEKRLEDLKTQLPKDYHPELQRSFWEDYENEQKSVRFKFAVYGKMKAIFTEFYVDDIMEFESDILRYFDRSLYLMCALPYVEEVYSL